MRKMRFAKSLLTYTVAAALLLGAGFYGASFDSHAETKYIIAEKAIVRDDANGAQTNSVTKGTAVEILDSKTGSEGKVWYKVSFTAGEYRHEGWVRSDLMSSTQPQASTTQPTTPDTTTQQQPDGQQPDGTQTPDDTQTPEDGQVDFTVPDANACGDGYEANGELTFAVMGKTLTLSSAFTDVQIPANFSKIDITYNGQNLSCLQCSYADVLLAYLTDSDGAGEFYVLDTENNVVYSYVTISSGASQLIVLLPPSDVVVADCYSKTIYAADADSVVTAYQYNELLSTVDVGTVAAEYFYVYGVTKQGEPGWYLCDDVEKTYVRATTDLSVDLNTLVLGENTPEPEADDSLEEMLIVVLGAICFIFLVMIIVFGIRAFCAKRKLRRYEEEHAPVPARYEAEEEEEELSFFQRRKQEREYRHFLEHFGEDSEVVQTIEPPKSMKKKKSVEPKKEEPTETIEPTKLVEPEKPAKSAESTKPVEPTGQDLVVEDILKINLMDELEKEGWIENYSETVETVEETNRVEKSAETVEEAEPEKTEKNEFDEIESILLAGLEDTLTQIEKEEESPVADKEKPDPDADIWKDLEFIDL